MLDRKICMICNVDKSAKDDYYWNKYENGNSYPKNACKACLIKKARDNEIANPDIKRERGRRYYYANARKINDIAKAWSRSEKGKTYKKLFRSIDAGKEYFKNYARTRRANISGATCEGSGAVDNKWFVSLVESQGFKCYYCLSQMDKPCMEHVIPITRHGLHTRDNIVAACRNCNSQKHNKLISEWRPWIDIPLYGLELATA